MTIQKNLIPQWLSQAWNTVKDNSSLSRFFKKEPGEKSGAARYLLYILYFFILFLFFLYLLFPYDKLKERIIHEIEARSALGIKIYKLSPILFNGVNLNQVDVFSRDDPKKASLFKGDMKIRIALLQLIRSRLNVKGKINAYNGEAVVDIASKKVAAEIREMDLGAYAVLKALYGIEMAGMLNGRLDLTSSADVFKNIPLNPARLSGESRFNVARFSLKNLNILGIRLPDAFFDAVQSELRISDGRLNIRRLSLEGRELNIQITGDIILIQDIYSSPLNIRIRIKPSIRFEEENKVFFSFGKAKDIDGFYNIEVSGTIRSPSLS